MSPTKRMTTLKVAGSQLGEGVYGTVFLLESPKEKRRVVKVYKRTNTLYFESIPEIDLLFRLKSKYLIQASRIYLPGEVAEGCAVEMPYIKGRLKDLFPTLNFHNMRRIMLHLALGLYHLHVGGRYLHLDISASNCLYTGTIAKPQGILADYGLAGSIEYDEKNRPLPLTTKGAKISDLHRAPECFPGTGEYTVKSDIWSLGILYLQIICRNKNPLLPNIRREKPVCDAVGNIDHNATMKKLAIGTSRLVDSNEFLGLVPIPWKRSAKRLLQSMLHLDPEKRPDTVRLLSASFFRGLEKTVEAAKVVQNPVPLREKPAEKFDLRAYRGLVYLREHLRRDFGVLRSELYFLVFDLYLRCAAGMIYKHADGQQDEKEADNKVQLVCVSCITIGIRALYSYADLPPGYIKRYVQHSPSFLQYEGHILRYLHGIVRRPWLYDACTSLEQLRHIDKELLSGYRPDLTQYYLTLSPKEYVASIKKTAPSTSKFVTIAAL